MILMTLYATGMRNAELTRLKTSAAVASSNGERENQWLMKIRFPLPVAVRETLIKPGANKSRFLDSAESPVNVRFGCTRNKVGVNQNLLRR
jgi:hypothetical protein